MTESSVIVGVSLAVHFFGPGPLQGARTFMQRRLTKRSLESSFHALGCITDILRKNGLHDWISGL